MPVARAHLRIVVLAAAVGTAVPIAAVADPMMGGRGMGGGGGSSFGVGAAVGAVLAAGAVATVIDDAVRRRDEAVQNGLAAGRAAGRKQISLKEFDDRMDAAYKLLRSRPKNKNYSNSELAGIALDKMNEKYTVARPEKYDNDAAFERSRLQNREMIRIKSGGRPDPSAVEDDRHRLKQSGMSQDEHDLLHNRGAQPKGTEW